MIDQFFFLFLQQIFPTINIFIFIIILQNWFFCQIQTLVVAYFFLVVVLYE